MNEFTSEKIRNIAIIAHVDHGKTTLVDAMLWQSGVFRENQNVSERVLDSMDLEREKGITIMSKTCSVQYKDTLINIVDTPGHADFGGEVERVMSMVDGVILLVDAYEGPLPQTKFVVEKAMQAKLPFIIVINKVDRSDQRATEVLDEIYDLFIDLDVTEEKLNFPVLYAIAKEGKIGSKLDELNANLESLFETILSEVPPPFSDSSESLQMLISRLEYDNYLGKLIIGRIKNGSMQLRQKALILGKDNQQSSQEITKLFTYEGIKLTEQKEASFGNIVAIAGFDEAEIGDTLTDIEKPSALPRIEVDDPTISMNFRINDTPLSGEGKFLTSRQIRDRLLHETKHNVAIQTHETNSTDTLRVSGRGCLHLSVLIEQLRREGYELTVGRPEVITKEGDNGKLEPIEKLIIEVKEEYIGTVTQKLGQRKGKMTDMRKITREDTRLEFIIPSRGLIGYHSEFITDTRGTGILTHLFHGWDDWKGDIKSRNSGAIIADRGGKSTAYSIENIQERATMFIHPQESVYEGMIVGENTREQDMYVNITKGKKLTNIRASNSDISTKIIPPKIFSLEQALEFLRDGECLEVTPSTFRLRKSELQSRKHA
jgi:GTP-binding protein